MFCELAKMGKGFAVLGLFACAAAVANWLLGYAYLGGFEALSLFIGGIGCLVIACTAKLYSSH